MLVFDLPTIGDRLFFIRKKAGLTQAEVAQAAELSDRTYAEIERGTVNMRIETLLKICSALHITPDELFTEDDPDNSADIEELMERLKDCSKRELKTALKILGAYLDSLN